MLALAPLPLEALVALKALAHWLTTGLPLVVAAPLLALTLSLPAPGLSLARREPRRRHPRPLASSAPSAPALTVGIRRGGLLLSILVLPLYIPTLIFGARAVAAAAEGRDPWPAFLLLAGAHPLHPRPRPLRRRRGAAASTCAELSARIARPRLRRSSPAREP